MFSITSQSGTHPLTQEELEILKTAVRRRENELSLRYRADVRSLETEDLKAEPHPELIKLEILLTKF